LQHRDFRRFLLGQLVSLSGTWMQSLALSWLVYRLTHSTVLMGTIGFLTQIPVLLLGPIAGVAADRYPRQMIVLGAQVAFLLHSLLLAVLTLTGVVQVWHLAVMGVVWGVINSFDIPGRQSLYVHLVGKDDLSNAIALNSMTFNAARVVGPSFGGLFVYAFGEGVCFLINAVSYGGVIAALASMKRVEPSREAPAAVLDHLWQGFRYAWEHPSVRGLLGMTAVANFAVAPAILLGPVYADAIFGQGSRGLGLLTGSVGIGAVIGTLVLAGRKQTGGMTRVVLWSAIGMGAALLVFAASAWFAVTLAAALAMGFCVFRQLVAGNTLIQSRITDEFRGRIMALYSMMAVGMLPLGNLMAGTAARLIGARWTVAAGGMICLAAAGMWAAGMNREGREG
jgi:MFS family permease